jgi:hypothetical protein
VKAAGHVEVEEVGEGQAAGGGRALLLPLRVDHDPPPIVDEHGVEQMRSDTQAGVDEAAQLGARPQGRPRARPGRRGQDAAGLRRDLPGDEVRLARVLLHEHPAQLRQVHQARRGRHHERQHGDDEDLPGAEAEAHVTSDSGEACCGASAR